MDFRSPRAAYGDWRWRNWISALAGAVALGRPGWRVLVGISADLSGRLGIDEGLEHRGEHETHHFAAVGGAQYVGELEQGRLVQGHRVIPLREFLGRFSQSLTRWPAHLGDRHLSPKSRASSYTTPRDAILCCAAGRGGCHCQCEHA